MRKNLREKGIRSELVKRTKIKQMWREGKGKVAEVREKESVGVCVCQREIERVKPVIN